MNAIPPRQITGADIVDVLKAATSRHTENDMHLSLLTRALICAAKTLKVPKFVVVRELDRAWDETEPLLRIFGKKS